MVAKKSSDLSNNFITRWALTLPDSASCVIFCWLSETKAISDAEKIALIKVSTKINKICVLKFPEGSIVVNLLLLLQYNVKFNNR